MYQVVGSFLYQKGLKWIVSSSTRSPGFSGIGLGVFLHHLFHLDFFFSSPARSRTRFTVLMLVLIPSFASSLCITAPQRGYGPNLFETIASTIVSGILFGEWCGLELSVGIPSRRSLGAFLHHFDIVPGLVPKYLATFLIDQPDSTNLTAFVLTFG